MSVTEKAVDEKLNTEESENNVSALDEILKDRDSKKSENEPIEIPEEKNKKGEPSKKNKEDEEKDLKSKEVKEVEKKPEEKEKNKEKPDSKTSGKSEKEEEDEDDVKYAEIDKLRKALNDSQKWGHSNNKRLKSVIKIVESLKDNAIINDDDFTKLNDLLHTDAPPECETVEINQDSIFGLIKMASEKILDLEELYDDDQLFRKKLAAFDFCINHSSDQDIDEIYEELKDLKDNPLKLAKRMFLIGEKYYNESYKDLDKAGGLKEFVSFKNSEIERLQRKVDKLEKKLLEYNDYDKPTFKIDELGDTNNVSEDRPGDVLGQALEERDRKKR